jgi:hypothetical protein
VRLKKLSRMQIAELAAHVLVRPYMNSLGTPANPKCP